jgi:hypothetical protein
VRVGGGWNWLRIVSNVEHLASTAVVLGRVCGCGSFVSTFMELSGTPH